MTREDAIYEIKQLAVLSNKKNIDRITEALEMAIEALADRKTENSSEIPNNCEHITEDGVTCAKYPACDDCLDNPLNKVKGSERLVKSSEQTEPTISKMEQVETMSCQECKHFHENAVMYLDQCDFCFKDCKYEPKDEPQTERSE